MSGRTEIEAKTERRVRTEKFDVQFVDGLADGWVFGVAKAFENPMDICYMQYVDKEKTKEFYRSNLGNLKSTKKFYRGALTRRNPPVRSFGEGDVFFDPPETHRRIWEEALKYLVRAIQIQRALPDSLDRNKNLIPGLVDFTLTHYKDGKVQSVEEKQMLQAEFESFLRFGK